MVLIPHQMSLGWPNRRCVRCGVWNTVERGEMYTGCWWGNPPERAHLEDPCVHGRLLVKWFLRHWISGCGLYSWGIHQDPKDVWLNAFCRHFDLNGFIFQILSNGIPVFSWINTPIYSFSYSPSVDLDRVVGIPTRYGLDGPGTEFRWGRDFPHPSRQALGPAPCHIQWVPGLSRG